MHALAYGRSCSWSKQLFVAPLRHEMEQIACLEKFHDIVEALGGEVMIRQLMQRLK